jgi:hypothetical protein
MLPEEIIYFTAPSLGEWEKCISVDEKKALVCHLVLFYCSVLLTQIVEGHV